MKEVCRISCKVVFNNGDSMERVIGKEYNEFTTIGDQDREVEYKIMEAFNVLEYLINDKGRNN